jgi:signal transduction histidine kinase
VVPVVLVSLLSTFLLFPDGHLPSRRWRPVAWLLLASGVVGLLSVSVVAQTNTLDTETVIENPLALGALSGWTWMAWVWAALLLAATVPSLASVVVRFRRSHGEERQQIRWLAWAAGLILMSLLAVFVTGLFVGTNGTSTANDLAFVALIGSATVGLPLACAIAILRYRLYDLDLVIKKAAVYTIVAIVITVVYAAALAIAALSFLGSVAAVILFVLTFNPVRRRARKLAERIVYGQRATPFEVLSEFSERVGETYSIDEVLPRMAQLLAASTGATETRVWLRTDRRLVPVAGWPADLPTTDDRELAGDELPAFEDVSSFPVTHQGDLLGAITLRLHANDPMDPTKERLVNGLASQAGLALRNVSLFEDLRASRRRIVSATDEERRRIERNIHDGAQQQLVALAVQLKLARTVVAGGDVGKAEPLLDRLQSAAATALEDLRDLARGIYPPLLADQGLVAALEAQARRAALPVTVHADGVGRYPQDVEATVYFCSLEALNNVAKYAGASRAEVDLVQQNGQLRFTVRDDGAGFDAATETSGTGLRGMTDRLDAVGGSLSIDSAPGRGTVVEGRVPVTVRTEP